MLLCILSSIVREKNDYTMDKNTCNERKKTDIGTGVHMSKYFNHKSLASQGTNKGRLVKLTHAQIRWTV